jgi:hypothetical protein
LDPKNPFFSFMLLLFFLWTEEQEPIYSKKIITLWSSQSQSDPKNSYSLTSKREKVKVRGEMKNGQKGVWFFGIFMWKFVK